LASKAAAADAELVDLRAELEASRRCVEEVRKEAGLCSNVVDVLSAQCADMQASYSQAMAEAVALQARLDASVAARDAAHEACAAKDKQCGESDAAMAELRQSVTALEHAVQAANQEAQQAAAAADAAAAAAASAVAAKEGEAQQARHATERACIERDVAVSEAVDAKALRVAAEKAWDDAVIAVRQLRGEVDVLSELTHPQLMAILAAMEAGMGNLRRAALAAEVAARTAEAAAASECAVCLGAARDTALTCGHLCCASCAAKLATCPICRQRVVSRTRVFI
jgi:chromosome segregation ATPase